MLRRPPTPKRTDTPFPYTPPFRSIWRRSSGDTPAVLALVKAEIAESLVKRLTMFVLRAKAKLRVTQSRVWGVSVSVAGGVDASLDGTDFPDRKRTRLNSSH